MSSRPLVTSSTVGVMLSWGIILFCTAALFLSGSVIQHRTMREIQVAIRQSADSASHMIVAPDRFRQVTTELEDGTIVALDKIHEKGVNKDGAVDAHVLPSPARTQDQLREDSPLVAIKQDHLGPGSPAVNQKEVLDAREISRRIQQELVRKDGTKEEKISAAERRRRIQEELRQMTHVKRGRFVQRLG